MSKSVVILCLVLAVSSSAGADIILTGPSAANPGDSVQIGVITTAGETLSSLTIAIISDGGAGGFANAPGVLNAGFTVDVNGGLNGNPFGFTSGDLVTVNGETASGVSVTGTLFSYTYDVSIDAVVGSTVVLTIGDLSAFGLISLATDFATGGTTGLDGQSHTIDIALDPVPNCFSSSLAIQTIPTGLTSVTQDEFLYDFITKSCSVNIHATKSINCPDVYRFDHWEGAGIVDPTLPDTNVLMDGDKTITAVFVDDRTCGDECHPNFQLGDHNHDCYVNVVDFAMFLSRWMTCTAPECD